VDSNGRCVGTGEIRCSASLRSSLSLRAVFALMHFSQRNRSERTNGLNVSRRPRMVPMPRRKEDFRFTIGAGAQKSVEPSAASEPDR
jgi:hypothetical protein